MLDTSFLEIKPNRWVESEISNISVNNSINCIEKYCGIIAESQFVLLPEVYNHILFLKGKCQPLDDDEYSDWLIAMAHYLAYLITKCLGGSILKTVKNKQELLAHVPSYNKGHLYRVERMLNEMIEHGSGQSQHVIPYLQIASKAEFIQQKFARGQKQSSAGLDNILKG